MTAHGHLSQESSISNWLVAFVQVSLAWLPSEGLSVVAVQGTELRHRPVASAAATSDTTSASTAPASSAAEQAAGTPSSQFGSASAYYQPSAYW